MAQEQEPLVIKDFTTLSPSPHKGPEGGFAFAQGLDNVSKPGSLQIAHKLEAQTVPGGFSALIKWFVAYTATTFYGLGDDGNIYKSVNSGGTWTLEHTDSNTGHGQGLMLWMNAIVWCSDTKVGVGFPIDGAIAWTDSWQTLESDVDFHPIEYSDEDMLYIGNGKYVASVAQVTGQTFNPGTPATYAWNNKALDLPTNEKIKSFAELGANLISGTWKGTNLYDHKQARLFPWNKADDSFELPVFIGQCGANAQLNCGNLLMVFAGIEGRIYRYGETFAQEIGRVPFQFDSDRYGQVYPGAVCDFKGKQYFGFSSADDIGYCGVFSTDLSGRLNLEFIVSTGHTTQVKIGAIQVIGKTSLLVSWHDVADGTYGIDKLNTTKRYNSGAYLKSMFYKVGMKKFPRSFQYFELQLDRDLLAGQSLVLKAREKLSTAWGSAVTIGTFSHNTQGAKSSWTFPKTFNCENIQLKLEFNTSASLDNSPRLLNLTAY